MLLFDFIRVLELAGSPANLVSGIGLLLLSMTNRFGRVIDRARILMPRLGGKGGEPEDRVTAQMRILARRAQALRTAITLAVASLLASVLLVAGLFVAAACGSEGSGVVAVLAACFVASMAGLIAALVLLLYELNISLQAPWLELPADCHGRRSPPHRGCRHGAGPPTHALRRPAGRGS